MRQPLFICLIVGRIIRVINRLVVMQYFRLLLPCKLEVVTGICTTKQALKKGFAELVGYTSKLKLAQHLASFGLHEPLISIKEVSEFL